MTKFFEQVAVQIVAGAIATAILFLVSLFVLSRALWGLGGARAWMETKIYVGCRRLSRAHGFLMHVIGVGQVQAIASIAPSLTRVYRWRSRDPLPVSEAHEAIKADDLRRNTILVGGPHCNPVTRKMLEEIGAGVGVEQERDHDGLLGDCFRVRRADGTWTEWHGTVPPDEPDCELREDFGLILKCRNPFDRRRMLILFAGVHTFGTAAAAQEFKSRWYDPRWWGRRGLVAVVRAEVRDGHVVHVEVLEFRRLPRRQIRRVLPRPIRPGVTKPTPRMRRSRASRKRRPRLDP